MLGCDRIDISKGIDINKTNTLEEFNICHYWYFLDKGFKYELHICNDCHDLMQKAMTFIDVAIVSIKQNDYRIQFWYMSKDDAIIIMKNANLNGKTGLLQFFTLYENEGKNLLSKKQRNNIKQSKRIL